ncbi:hypothetical protein B0H65DRAFT_512590 [Neurospora tetraspora]|uniref:Glycosyltransferase family 17 protein n=1 Tax=Neurospora tetraspora TaxID=94610 RepID=A0AAE0J1S1_9PEZI|nr:hypothetical protein B0H65DRAFT_512590 [Neurospora tetraspora]
MLLQPITNPGKCARSLAVLLSIWAFIYLFSPFNLRLDKNEISYNDEAIWGNRHDICRAYGWKPYQPRQSSDPPRKLYDLVLVTTELDLLEVRFNTTWDAVDYYVLVESAKTFTGRNKPLLLKQALDETPSRFETYKSKIIYHQVQYPEDFSPPPTPPRGSGSGSGSASVSPWEDFHLNAMFDQVFPLLEAETKSPMTNPNVNSDLQSSYPLSLSNSSSSSSKSSSPRRPHTNDILLLSLAPEIPRPHILGLLRECFFPERLTLSSKMHYYSFQFVRRPSWFSRTQDYGPGYIDRESREVEWSHPQATVYRGTGTRGKTVKMGGSAGLRYGSRSGVIAGIGGGKWWNGWMGKGTWAENWLARWEGRETLRSASWTCEACFPTLAQFLLKDDEVYGPGHRLDSLTNSDTEKERIVRYVREGKDLWSDLHEREEGGKWVFEEVVNNTDVPSLLLGSEGKEGRRLGFLMERGGRSGGFRDYKVPRVGVVEDTENVKEGEERVVAIGKQG